MASEYDRRQLYVALEQQIGEGPAGTLMEMLPPVGWVDVATRSDIEASRKEFKGEMALLRGEMAELRGEMAELRGEIKAQLPKLYAANLAGAIATAGLVLAAAKLA